MPTLPSALRGQLDTAIQKARAAAESGARKALEALAVDRSAPHTSMNEDERALRRRLRVHGRQLGDSLLQDRTQEIDLLVHEVAYEHWHRMLFARFLAENHLLIEPNSKASITMDECADLAREGNEDPWALAASFAEGMLPDIFRSGDPALEVKLPPEARQALQRLLASLPEVVFTADDSLGWTYQFWQTAEKEEVNSRVKSGEKITGRTLPAVTQLFTEPYMVQFLLHNTIGAWHAGKVLSEDVRSRAASEQELRDAVRLRAVGGYDFEYLRFVREQDAGGDGEEGAGPWRPAAGTFDGWPKTAAELNVLDPCCGSGHFLVAAFELLVRLRMDEEGLALTNAVRAVIRDNLFGLELDKRCTQIAAFNLAFAAWKLVGRRIDLPAMQIACSGIGPQATRSEWISLAEKAAAAGGMPGKQNLFGGDETLLSAALRDSLGKLYDLFEKAPELGSLIDPKSVSGGASDLFKLDFDTLLPVLDAVLERERADDETIERAVAAKGMADAARILTGPKGGYTLVITNVPYLTRQSHSAFFANWAKMHMPRAQNDIATMLFDRALTLSNQSQGTTALVLPQHWTSLRRYRGFRENIIGSCSICALARLGAGAFATISGEVVNVLLAIVSPTRPDNDHAFWGLDATALDSVKSKSTYMANSNDHIIINQHDLRLVPDHRIVFEVKSHSVKLSRYANAWQGIAVSDSNRFVRYFWELANIDCGWHLMQSNSSSTILFGGKHLCVFWQDGNGQITEVCQKGATFRGQAAWGNDGVAVGQFKSLYATLYHGTIFDGNAHIIIPDEPEHLPAIWAYCESSGLRDEIHRLTQAMAIKNKVIGHAGFDLEYWQKVAAEKYPNGLPEPCSDDPTQWLFHGHPAHAESGMELQVAVARLLGYRWPAEQDESIRLSDDARALVAKSRDLDAHGLSDADGIVSLSPLRGQVSAAERLRALLAKAYGTDWSAAKERQLIAAAASRHGTRRVATNLDEWLRNAFFEEHIQLFGHRPFIWHVWDGLPQGFSALVNYHRLAAHSGAGRRALDLLTFAYLGDWIDRQRAAQQDGKEGADGRLAGAQRLQEELQSILEGEPPYDIFVRWKPLDEQSIGWQPDINDGVRLNIRPFLQAADVGRKGAGILRHKPNVKWGKDRGKEPEDLRPPEHFPWFYGCDPEERPEHRIDFGAGTRASAATGDFDGARWNDLHYTRAAKNEARERKATEISS